MLYPVCSPCMACSSLADSATRVRSSAYWMFWISAVHGVFSLYDKNSPSVVVYSILQPPGVIFSASLRTLSMKQLKSSGESMQACLTPLTTLNFSDAPSVVLTWHHVLVVYIALMMSTRWLGTLLFLRTAMRASRFTES